MLKRVVILTSYPAFYYLCNLLFHLQWKLYEIKKYWNRLIVYCISIAISDMISATTTWTDTPEYKYIWKDSLVTDVIVTGDYYGNTQHKHIVYDMTVNSPRSGIALFMSLFDASILMAKYLTGEIGGYVPSHPIAAIYIYNDVQLGL